MAEFAVVQTTGGVLEFVLRTEKKQTTGDQKPYLITFFGSFKGGWKVSFDRSTLLMEWARSLLSSNLC